MKKKEISAGRVMDFSLKSSFPNIHSSIQTQCRLANDNTFVLSSITGNYNFFIGPHQCSVRFTAFDTVIKMIGTLGPLERLKKNVFRLFTIHQDDRVVIL